MNLKKKPLICLCSSLVLACSFILIANSSNTLIKGKASDEHGANCNWNHYDKVEATYNHHGSEEFYACCTHPGNFSFEKPSEGKITDMGAFKGEFFDSLDSNDSRYIAPLFENMDVLYDNQYNYLVVGGSNDYMPASWDYSVGNIDDTYGYYCTLDIKESAPAEQWVWFKPALSTDITSYKQIIFYIKSNQDVTIQLNGYDATAIKSGNYVLNKDVWTKIVYNVSNGATSLDQIAPSFWLETVRTNLVWDITSIYGVSTSTSSDPFEGMDKLYDASSNVLVPQNYTPADYITEAGLTDSKYGSYSTITVNSLGVDAVWFRVSDAFKDMNITDYKGVVFYIKSNQEITNLNVRADNWTVVVGNTTLTPNVWTKVVVPVDGTTVSKLKDVAPASWGEYTNLVWCITSIYGVK